MLSYQHGYHAGNLADLHKHAALAVLLAALTVKDKPLSYLESHAGRGLYDLAAPEAAKTGEAAEGVEEALARRALLDDHPWVRAVEATRARHGPTAYPGSPAIARALLRPADRLHLMELHPQEHAALRAALHGPGVHIHRRDGHEGLPALVPPTPRRGLALIDPSYEVKDEYARAARLLLDVHRRWPEGVILLWYPVLDAGMHGELLRTLEAAGVAKPWTEEVRFAGSRLRMRGSGLVCVNTPYGAEAALRAGSTALFG
ncbi:ribosomal RNA large subunit methyltransferase J [Thalassobaculum fulvum]|uniref:Ribosomal RNA large subunit methyltransferase J n=1 Tax=Thalassobaculum fulvum TaxID=1633335 RepID=A0A919CMT2_9PROT|nr:23S rRNA (adenine(2030)-N(6))-methyltransferase RlmJ [Thalassobaculum fulvum]GHD41117.1 ribosomal RNA large subunit methyltransferase J [Thalassobaculum fulvum]